MGDIQHNYYLNILEKQLNHIAELYHKESNACRKCRNLIKSFKSFECLLDGHTARFDVLTLEDHLELLKDYERELINKYKMHLDMKRTTQPVKAFINTLIELSIYSRRNAAEILEGSECKRVTKALNESVERY